MKNTTYLDQVKVNTTTDLKTVTGHIILTRGIHHGIPWETNKGLEYIDSSFVCECRNAPSGLPLIDQSTPIGSSISL